MLKTGSRLQLAAAAIAAATLLAGCGSNSPTSSSSSGSGGHASFAQQQEVVRFADCMRSHGVPNLPDPTTSPHAFKTALNTNSPAFGAGYTACHRFLPGGGSSTRSEPHTQAQIAAFLSFVSCLRSHGFPSFPDPTSTGELTHQMVAAAGIDLHQPAVVQAGDACVGVTHGNITRADVARFVAGQ